jgi:hypothetical protein
MAVGVDTCRVLRLPRCTSHFRRRREPCALATGPLVIGPQPTFLVLVIAGTIANNAYAPPSAVGSTRPPEPAGPIQWTSGQVGSAYAHLAVKPTRAAPAKEAAHASTETRCNTDPQPFSLGHCGSVARSSPHVTRDTTGLDICPDVNSVERMTLPRGQMRHRLTPCTTAKGDDWRCCQCP